MSTWIEHESDTYRVTGHSTGDLMIENRYSGESVYLQGDDADGPRKVLAAVVTTPDEIAAEHYLSQYFGN